MGIAVAGALLLTSACAVSEPPAPGGQSKPTIIPVPPVTQVSDARVPKELKPAVSLPREDSRHPDAGDPGVDALSYDLDLTWTPDAQRLEGVATIVLRSMRDQPSIRLDLGAALHAPQATVDGVTGPADHHDDYLDIDGDFRAGHVYTVKVAYDGTPRPTKLSDGATLGVQLPDTGGLSVCEEPIGAFTWYPVNDQPADKAFYSFTLHVPAPMVGVANGQLQSRATAGGVTTTRWTLDRPTSSYLTTVAFGDLTETRLGTVNGTPVSTWTPTGDSYTRDRLSYADDALRWVEERLGRYPFASLGVLANAGTGCGMETQTMITLGVGDYVTSKPVIVHEIVHQWWGDEVTPNDWRDPWMNEGMAYYLQKVYEAQSEHKPLDTVMADLRKQAAKSVKRDGPAGDYHGTWGLSIYDSPAVMWHEIRGMVGDKEFWHLVSTWPTVHRYGSSDREQLIAWWSKESGQNLKPIFNAYLSGKAFS
jgi:aminopeptidase N